jgi:hypothetical protein
MGKKLCLLVCLVVESLERRKSVTELMKLYVSEIKKFELGKAKYEEKHDSYKKETGLRKREHGRNDCITIT